MSALRKKSASILEKIIGRYISDRAIYKVFTDAFVVMLVTRLAYASGGMVDGIMISKFLDTDAIAAYTLVYPIISMMAVLSSLMSVGLQTVLSRHIGKSEFREADNIFTQVAIVGSFLALVFTVVGFIFIEPFVLLFGVDKSTPLLYSYVRSYLAGMLFGTVPMVLKDILVPVLQINGDNRRIKLTLVLCVGVNITFNYMAIFVFHSGLWGIGLATSVSQFVALMLTGSHFFRKKLLCRFRFTSLDLAGLKKVFASGLPMATQRICSTLSPMLVNRCVLAVGTSTIMAAIGVTENIFMLLAVPKRACFFAITMAAGVYYSERDKTALRELTKVSIVFNLTVNLLISAAFFLLAPLIVTIYTPKGTEVYEVAVVCLRWCCLGSFIGAANDHFRGLMLGLGKHKQVHKLTTLQLLVYRVASTWILSLIFGIPGLLASYTFTELLTLIHILVELSIKNRKFPRTTDNILLLPDDFELAAEENFALSIDSAKDVSNISRHIEAFCIAQGVDHKRAMYTSLCAEEMALIIVEHGFSDDKKCSLSIRVWYQNDELTLRLRDNCELFDIREQYEKMDNEDIFSNMSIRMVMNMAKDVSYVNSFNINNTTIKL